MRQSRLAVAGAWIHSYPDVFINAADGIGEHDPPNSATVGGNLRGGMGYRLGSEKADRYTISPGVYLQYRATAQP